MAQMLNDSAQAVREAVKSKAQAGQEMNLHFDHPILMLQHMIWHEGYHHGQIKLALKLAGRPLTNKEAGPLTWRVWMQKEVTVSACYYLCHPERRNCFAQRSGSEVEGPPLLPVPLMLP